MATRKNVKTKKQTEKISLDLPQTLEEPAKKQPKTSFMVNLGWGLLLIGGLSHMLPTQMEPVLKLAQFGISVQMIIGVLSVLIALNFLLGDE